LAEQKTVSPVGCFGPRSWQDILDQAQQVLDELSVDPALCAVAHRVASLVPSQEARQGAFWILLSVLVSESAGHTRVDLEHPDWPEPLAKAMGPWDDLVKALDTPELEPLIGTDGKPLIREGRWLASQRLRESEARVAAAVKARVARPTGQVIPSEQVLIDPVQLNADQQRAVALAMTAPLTLITGRPGTGKTSIVIALLRALQRQVNPIPLDRILLAAPTGKAAQRMGEAIRLGLDGIRKPDDLDALLRRDGPEPKTLHRTLGYHPGMGGFRYNADNPMPADLVIVDEASMIGLELQEGLLAALAPETRLVLLGDADQLPSVDPGAAFRELVASLPNATVTLHESYRMDPRNPKGRHILLQAERINDPTRTQELWGKDGIHQGTLEEAMGQGGVWLVEPQAPKLRWMAAFLDRWMKERVWANEGPSAWCTRVLQPLQHQANAWVMADQERAMALLAHFDSFRLLCPVNEGPDLSGVDQLNYYLHSMALKAAADSLEWQPHFIAGDPVMVLSNDSRRGLFNGDQGLILPVKRGEGSTHLEAIFPRGESLVGFPLPSIQDSLAHAYAMTVHKAQGSEFKALALVMPPEEHPSLTKEVLYTALTRAKTEILLLGTLEAVEGSCLQSIPRRSGLRELI
jgi:exodeoxyribonuclease V alpha subunit